MLNQPMSSPMMKTMFGLFTLSWAREEVLAVGSARASNWPLFMSAGQQAGLLSLPEPAGCALTASEGGGAAAACRNGLSLPDAARWPSSTPAARTTAICTLTLRNIALLLSRADALPLTGVVGPHSAGRPGRPERGPGRPVQGS